MLALGVEYLLGIGAVESAYFGNNAIFNTNVALVAGDAGAVKKMPF